MKNCWFKRFLLKIYWEINDYYTDWVVKVGRINKKKVVFDNFFGRGYGENPKYIAEEIHKQGLNWDMVWLLSDMKTELPSFLRAVQYGSNQAKRELATAHVVVNNIRNSMRTKKKKGQIYVQTWHGGFGFKKVEAEAEGKLSDNYIAAAKKDGSECDAIISSCAMQTLEYENNFWLAPQVNILEFGQPRADVLFSDSQEEIERKVKNDLKIPENKTIILYAPTFRDNKTTECFKLDFKRIIETFEKKYARDFVVIVRMHPNIHHLVNFIQYDHTIINGSVYPDIQELYIASDYLISDYSSAAYDFSLLNKPVFLCMLDFEEYIQLRGFTEAFDISPFPKAYTNDQLIEMIEQFDYQEYMKIFNEFKTSKWKPYDDGHASERVVHWLKTLI